MRAALLDSLVSGAAIANAAAAAAVAVTQPRAGAWQQSDASTRPGKPRAATNDSDMAAGQTTATASAAFTGATSAAESRAPIGAIAIGVVVLAIAGIGVWLWLGRASSGADSSGGAPTAAEQGRIHQLLTQFTDRGDWNDAHLATLNTDLLELGGARLSESAGEPWFQRFVDEVRQRLKEQQALAATPLSADNSPLAALAVTVGLDLNAPDAAIHIVALPPPPKPESTATTLSPPAAKTSASSMHAASVSPEAEVKSSPSAKPSVAAPKQVIDPIATQAAPTAAPNAKATATTAEADSHEGACRLELVGTRRPFCHDVLASGMEGPPLALIPAGAFDMGSTAAPEEQPVHRVTMRAPFAISVYEVSQGEFKQFCGRTDRSCPKQPWSGDDYPIVNVTWEDAREYAEWLSSVTHHRYSLPSEAQWEYAARAGRTGLVPNGDALSPTDAHYSMLAKQAAAAPRSQKFNANAFKLMHTLGNVREWVEDAWTPSFAGAPSDGAAAAAAQSASQRVARGGSYADGPTRLRLSLREGLPAGTRDATTGFRIVRELP
jgi:formylglycine-generating enzyme required for sulfatase activity